MLVQKITNTEFLDKSSTGN